MSATLQVWRNRVACTVRVKQPEDIDAIALRCFNADQAGQPTGVWHEAAGFYGNADRCPCFPCTKARKGAAQ